MEEIYRKYSKLVFNYLYSLSRDIDVAEELTQETFYSAIKGIRKFRQECSINVWLCQIAKNKWKDYLMRKKNVKLVPFDEVIENNIYYTIDSEYDSIELCRQIDKLDEKTREIFYLKIKGELTFKEIGKIFGKSEEWARISFYRGKIKLKEELKND